MSREGKSPWVILNAHYLIKLGTFVRASTREASESEWLLKMSHNAWRLHVEAEAHIRMARVGVSFARITPLLWRDVVTTQRSAAIAYQFARGTYQASKELEPKTLRDIGKRVSTLLIDFYPKAPRQERMTTQDVLSNWFSAVPPTLPAGTDRGIEKTLKGFFSRNLEACSSLYLKCCMIHGDLHLDNVMLGSNADIMIDFARSKYAPLAVDAAKVISDLILRWECFRGERLPEWGDVSTHPVSDFINEVRSVFDFESDDESLFRLLLIANLASALSFSNDGLPEGTKAWLKQILLKECASQPRLSI